LITGKTANNKIEIYMINRIKNRKRLAPFLMVVRELHELHELWPHSAALDGFAVYKKAALQLSIRVIREIDNNQRNNRT
jgi:hypothetical protein